MRRYSYNDLKEYVNTQTEWNKKKLSVVWANKNTIKKVSDYIKTNIGKVGFGLCHGTRRGNEQKWFSEELGCIVIGTEISDTATKFPNTIQWDFHDVKDEWIGAVDFIYSNSLDHSYNPESALKQWLSCLTSEGLCFIEWSPGHDDSHTNKIDCFGASIDEMETFLKGVALVLDRMEVDNGSVVFVITRKKD